MEANRLKRFRDKLEWIETRVGEVQDWKVAFLTDEKTKLACYKAFQEIAESAMDVLAMIAMEEAKVPKDDYSNIEFALKKNIINKEVAASLERANGLRNRIIHRYNGLDAEKAFESINILLPIFNDFIESVEKWLEKT